MNHNFNPAIGNLQPAKCLGQDADEIIRDRLRDLGRLKTPLNLPEQEREKTRIRKDKKYAPFQIGMSVLLDLPKTTLVEKESHPKVLQSSCAKIEIMAFFDIIMVCKILSKNFHCSQEKSINRFLEKSIFLPALVATSIQ